MLFLCLFCAGEQEGRGQEPDLTEMLRRNTAQMPIEEMLHRVTVPPPQPPVDPMQMLMGQMLGNPAGAMDGLQGLLAGLYQMRALAVEVESGRQPDPNVRRGLEQLVGAADQFTQRVEVLLFIPINLARLPQHAHSASETPTSKAAQQLEDQLSRFLRTDELIPYESAREQIEKGISEADQNETWKQDARRFFEFYDNAAIRKRIRLVVTFLNKIQVGPQDRESFIGAALVDSVKGDDGSPSCVPGAENRAIIALEALMRQHIEGVTRCMIEPEIDTARDRISRIARQEGIESSVKRAELETLRGDLLGFYGEIPESLNETFAFAFGEL